MLTNRAAKILALVVTFALVAGCTQSVEDLRAAGDVQGLVERLGPDSTAQERAEAATALGALAAEKGPESSATAEAVDHLVIALDDSEPTVRVAAVLGLGEVGVGAACVQILGALEDESRDVREAAQAALGSLAGDLDPTMATDMLVVATGDASDVVRAAAVEQLGEVGTSVAILPLLQAGADTSADVRLGAALALTALLDRVASSDAATALFVGLEQGDPTVRAEAARRLGEIGWATAIQPLLTAMGDTASAVRAAASTALSAVLGRLPDATAVDSMLQATATGDPVLDAAAAQVLEDLLLRIGPARAADALTKADASDFWLAIALGVAEAKLAAETRRLGIQLEPLDGIRDAADAAGGGRAVAGAHRYAATGAYHPAIVLAPLLQDLAKVSWSPTALRFLELVVTQKTSWLKIQTCRYYGPDIVRYRAVVTIKVVAASTGKTVASKSYTGPAPRACRKSEPYSLTRLEGAQPSLGPAISWLNSLIHPPS